MKTYSFTVSKKQRGERLNLYLYQQFADDFSKKAIKRFVDKRQCKVNGKVETFSSYKVKEQDEIEFVIHNETKKEEIKILYEDEDLVVVNKPIETASSADLFQKLLSIPVLHLVHRLDKGTTGALVLAKTFLAKKKLEGLFRQRKVYKRYLALSICNPKSGSFKVENYLAPICEYEGGKLMGEVKKESGKLAKSSFKVLKKNENFCMLSCEIETGVTHQIRVHAMQSKVPILGDLQYDKNQKFFPFAKRPMLHAECISFSHPRTNDELEIIADLPNDFMKAKEHVFR